MKSLLLLDFVASAFHPLFCLFGGFFCSIYLLFQTVFDIDSCFRQPVGLLNSSNSTCYLFIFISKMKLMHGVLKTESFHRFFHFYAFLFWIFFYAETFFTPNFKCFAPTYFPSSNPSPSARLEGFKGHTDVNIAFAQFFFFGNWINSHLLSHMLDSPQWVNLLPFAVFHFSPCVES